MKQKYIYSDYIEKYDRKLAKLRVLIIITAKSIYILNPKDFSILA